jgi:hypothetical protein
MYISRKGIFTDGGVPCQLAAALKTAVGDQASFTAFNKLAKRTAVQGECDLAGAGDIVLGVFVDCSPKGDSGTVETKGYEVVSAPAHGVAVGGTVTVAAGGTLAATAVDGVGTVAELSAGVWQVDQVIDADNVLIQIDARL